MRNWNVRTAVPEHISNFIKEEGYADGVRAGYHKGAEDEFVFISDIYYKKSEKEFKEFIESANSEVETLQQRLQDAYNEGFKQGEEVGEKNGREKFKQSFREHFGLRI